VSYADAKRVLVVEDDHVIRSAVADALEDEGYAVETAANGAIALEIVRDAPPDAIVLDLMMPVMDGWQFLAACRGDRLCDGVPVVVTSAHGRLAEVAPDLHVEACLAKPFDLDVLLGAIQRLVSRTAGTHGIAVRGS
jgi:DNA-binding response OmpR family regulator